MAVYVFTCCPPATILSAHLLPNSLDLHLGFYHFYRRDYDRLRQSSPAARPPVIDELVRIVILQRDAIDGKYRGVHGGNAKQWRCHPLLDLHKVDKSIKQR